MPVEINQHDKLDTLNLEIGDTWKGTLVDINDEQDKDYDTGAPLFWSDGNPKMLWIARLRLAGATDRLDDVNWWTRSQVKKALNAAVAQYPDNYLGAEIEIERLPDGKPSNPKFKAPHQYKVEVVTPGPDNWVDPLASTGPQYDAEEAPF